jgi:hypothetical protein
MELIKDNRSSLNLRSFAIENDVGSLKDLLTHVHHGVVPLLDVDLEIHGVICPYRHFFLE